VFQIGAREFHMGDFRGSVDAVLEESVKHMIDKTGPLDAVGRILLTGGGAPVFHEFLLRRYPELARVIQIDADPVFSNVRGFQIAGEVMERSRAS
jgi:plasmid segregation protein ParM